VPSLVAAVFEPGQLSGTTQPTLRTGPILLRPWTKVDASHLVEAYREPEIQRWHARSMTLPEAEQWIAAAGAAWTDETGASWAVDIGGRLAGRMTLKFNLGDACAGVGYWTRQADRGGGVAPQALLAATRWAFDQGFHRVQLEHSVQNRASCRVAAKAEFSEEGIRRSAALHADGWHDMHLHGRVNTAPSATP
jgi:ribosomal-protein-alanine N-acetyltransferase